MTTGTLERLQARYSRDAAPPELPDTAPPAERLFAAPQQFDFFQAVRLLEALQPGRRGVGSDASPRDEIVRFEAALGAAFPASSIADLAPARDDDDQRRAPRMSVAFMGLTGPSGVLPAHYTELLWRLQRDVRTPEKEAVRAWFDLFNHRLVSLFHRAWEKYRPFVAYQRGEYREPAPDTFTQGLLSLAGIPRERDRPDPHAPSRAYRLPRALLRYAGLLAQRPRNVANLNTLLNDFFALPIEIVQFQGEWIALACDQQMQLGLSGVLGCDAVVGPRVWHRQGKIRLRIGPLSREQFERLLPQGDPSREEEPRLGEIAAVTRFYLGPAIDFDLQLVLRGEDVPMAHLGNAPASRLGWNAWLPGASAHDRSDATFAATCVE
jgi:type VI secretion system protein ImpH